MTEFSFLLNGLFRGLKKRAMEYARLNSDSCSHIFKYLLADSWEACGFCWRYSERGISVSHMVPPAKAEWSLIIGQSCIKIGREYIEVANDSLNN